jgi:hypothetical protein
MVSVCTIVYLDHRSYITPSVFVRLFVGESIVQLSFYGHFFEF